MKHAESLESTKDREGDAWLTESNSSLLSALQTSQVLHISTYAQMFYNIFNAVVNLKFYYNYYSVRSKQCASMSSWLFAVLFFLFFFYTKRKFIEVAHDNIQKGFRIYILKLIIHRKILLERKNFTKNDLRTPYLAQMTTTTFAYYLLTNSNESVSL